MDTQLHPAENFTSEVRPLSTDWLVSFKDPRQLLQEHPFALALEVGSALVLALVFRHAKRQNPQEAYLLLAAMFTTTCFEILPIIPRPGYMLWWYHQGTVNLLKHRLPLYVVCCFALVHHLAHCVTSSCDLPRWSRSTATALIALLLTLPGLWFSQPLLLSIFHVDDPVFSNRLLGIPFIQIVVLTLLFFHTSHLFFQNLEDIPLGDRNLVNMVKCALQTGLVSAIYTIVEQYLLYILFSLTLGAHTGFCALALLAILLCIARKEMQCLQLKSVVFRGFSTPFRRPAWWALVATFAFFVSLPLWLDTQALKSTGERLEIGPCNVRHSVANTSPLEFERRRYICPEDTAHLAFDFHCVGTAELSRAVHKKTSHYSICGKPLTDTARAARATAAYALPCLTVFYFLMSCSFQFALQEKKVENCKKWQ
ncbi:uncharacterized protein LOC129229287 [Uloborus diversus]|uniref:uncharacterized protein LOC129229287 n=1 Tax=Uloborus diversus TaxID=327109 RepID=UPI002409A5C5|nr:uncharacterized protein LOC129229287 [Uloborus diversus]